MGFCLSNLAELAIRSLEQSNHGRKPERRSVARLLAGRSGLLATAAKQIIFLRPAGGVAGVVSIPRQFHFGLHPFSVAVPMAGKFL